MNFATVQMLNNSTVLSNLVPEHKNLVILMYSCLYNTSISMMDVIKVKKKTNFFYIQCYIINLKKNETKIIIKKLKIRLFMKEALICTRYFYSFPVLLFWN